MYIFFVSDNYPDHGIVDIYNANVKLYNYSSLGGFNDPDMLEVGNGNFTYEENKTHFTLWCMMAAPLLLGNDLRVFINNDGSINYSNPAYKILTNKDLIDIDQDSKGIQGRIVKTIGNIEILAKPLYNNDLALCFFNKSTTTQTSSISILEILTQTFITLPKLSIYKLFDLWDKNITSTNDIINVTIPPHGIKAYRICKHFIGELTQNQDFFINSDSVLETSSSVKIIALFQNTGKETISNLKLNLQVPTGFTVTPISTSANNLSTGKIFTAEWNIYTSSTKGDFNLTANATFNYSSSSNTKSLTIIKPIKLLNTPKIGDTLSNIDFISATTDYGTIQFNKSIDGNPLTINGQLYNSGIGTHANSEIKFFNGEKSLKFSAIVGIDDEVKGGDPFGGFPSAIFQVWGDNEKIYDSGILRYKQNATIFLDLTKYKIITLKSLVAKDFKDNNFFDHCDWANISFKANKSCSIN